MRNSATAPDAVHRTSKKAKKKAAPPADAQPLSDGELALYGRLKELRLELAKEKGVPAYVVFSDKSLHDMALKRPRSEAEFADVFGVGEAKLKEFSEPFLQEIARDATGTRLNRRRASDVVP